MWPEKQIGGIPPWIMEYSGPCNIFSKGTSKTHERINDFYLCGIIFLRLSSPIVFKSVLLNVHLGSSSAKSRTSVQFLFHGGVESNVATG